MYDELALVAGKDMATGSFAKQFGDIDLPPTMNLDCSIGLDDSSDNTTKGTEDPSRVNRKRNRATNKDDKFAMLSKQIGEVASALKKMSKNELDVAELYKEVMEVEGFDEATLIYAFDYLVENERVAKAFIIKSAKQKKLWLEDFVDKRGNGN
ncbi:Dof-type domain-containing protein [Psidium guajava]|nr:Dof-type domain-containing protein [Psidium guajava]